MQKKNFKKLTSTKRENEFSRKYEGNHRQHRKNCVYAPKTMAEQQKGWVLHVQCSLLRQKDTCMFDYTKYRGIISWKIKNSAKHKNEKNYKMKRNKMNT